VLDEKHSQSVKRDIQIVEAVLLWIAKDTDRLPGQNAKGGNFSRLSALFANHGVVKVYVDGYDPLQDPATGKRLKSKKTAKIWIADDGDFELEDDWRLRRRK